MLDAQKLRVAVALAALRNKPTEQSLESYVLDLRDKYTLSLTNHVKEWEQWRSRALSLENELREVRQKYDNEHAELLSLRLPTTESAVEAVPACSAPAAISHEKKRPQKKAKKGKPLQPACHEHIPLSNPDSPMYTRFGTSLPSFPSADSILASLTPLDALIARKDSKSKKDQESILLMTERALAAIAAGFSSVVLPHTGVTPRAEVIDSLATILDRLLTTAFPLCYDGSSTTKKTKKRKREVEARSDSTEKMDALFGRLATTLLVPLVRYFATLSQNCITMILEPDDIPLKQRRLSGDESRVQPCDVRSHLLAFIQRSVDSLQRLASSYSDSKHFELVASIQGIYEALMLSVVSELEDLYDAHSNYPLRPAENVSTNEAAVTANSPPDPSPTRQYSGIVQKLARKDTLWYLCSLMHLLIPASTTVNGLMLAASSTASRCIASSSPDIARASSAGSSSDYHIQQGLSLPSYSDRVGAQQRHKLLAEGTCVTLSRILRKMSTSSNHVRRDRRGNRVALREVERAMILAVAERLWFSL
ncbi:hypothetical protein BC835DRAFT_1379486, partial [Cytidiella melzeri]